MCAAHRSLSVSSSPLQLCLTVVFGTSPSGAEASAPLGLVPKTTPCVDRASDAGSRVHITNGRAELISLWVQIPSPQLTFTASHQTALDAPPPQDILLLVKDRVMILYSKLTNAVAAANLHSTTHPNHHTACTLFYIIPRDNPQLVFCFAC